MDAHPCVRFRGGVTLLFLMLMVFVVVIFGKSLGRDGRFLVISIIAFGLALAGGFLGSSGTLSGTMPLPGALKDPLTLGLAGGAAVFAVVWIIGYWLYGRHGPPPRMRSLLITLKEPTSLKQYGWLQKEVNNSTVSFSSPTKLHSVSAQ